VPLTRLPQLGAVERGRACLQFAIEPLPLSSTAPAPVPASDPEGSIGGRRVRKRDLRKPA